MTNLRYSTAQRIAFACLTIGFLMCAAGAIAPFWQYGGISVSNVASILNINVADIIPFANEKIVKMYGGLWWYCYEVSIGQHDKTCYSYPLDDSKIKDWIIRGGAVLNLILALMCTLAALCRSCCCEGGKTVLHGVMAFFAGAAGFTAIGIFASTASDGIFMQLKLEDFGWAFFLYIAGCAVITIVSFILCFASPMSPFAGMIISRVGPFLPNGYKRMTSDQVLLSQPSDEAFNASNAIRY